MTLPTPGVTPQITYNDMFALDANTVFLVGNGFHARLYLELQMGDQLARYNGKYFKYLSCWQF
jgi:hypothetical protein